MRREFPSRVKLLAWERSGGHCEQCTRKLFPGDINYDHDNPDGLTGTPELSNCRVLCRACHGVKTKHDVKVISRAKRIRKKHHGIKKPRTIRQWRRFDGSIVTAPKER